MHKPARKQGRYSMGSNRLGKVLVEHWRFRMKPLSETRALEKLRSLQADFARDIRNTYEHRAKDCNTCETPGACCLDAHFVNVRITRLEATAIKRVIDGLPAGERGAVLERVERAAEALRLSSGNDAESQFFSCPLFEKGTGCLVHDKAKPLPCIAHACYEKQQDLPPDQLLIEQEGLVAKLNESVYRKSSVAIPLPLAIPTS
jgi:hypothetical protein